MKKTLLDLYQSAHNGATKALNAPNSFAIENIKIEAFNADGNAPADWDQWSQFFTQRHDAMAALAKQPAPSASAPAAAPAPAKTT